MKNKSNEESFICDQDVEHLSKYKMIYGNLCPTKAVDMQLENITYLNRFSDKSYWSIEIEEYINKKAA
jgi:hypothetical protein